MAAAIIIPYLNHLPSEYKKAVKTLNRKLAKSNSSAEKCRHLEAFTDKYTAVSEIWKYWLRLVRYCSAEWNEIREKENKNFPEYATRLKEWPTYQTDPIITYSNDEKNRAKLHQGTKYAMDIFLSLPHSELSAALEFFDEVSPNPLTKEMIKKHKAAYELYQQTKEADISNAEKYIELLKKSENDEFVIKNIEIQLFKNSWCQSLWLAYIQYLEGDKMEEKVVLQVLQRYCRLFVNDKKMKEKYQTKIEEFSQTSADEMTEFWIDSIKFEFHFQNFVAGKQLMEKLLNHKFAEKNFTAIYDVIKLYCKRYSFEDIFAKAENIKKNYIKDKSLHALSQLPTTVFDSNTKIQKLPFCKPINQYLYDKISHQHLQKLYQTCKWFYYKYRYNLVHRLTLFTIGYNNNKIYRQFYNNSASVNMGRACTEKIPLRRLWLAHSLKIEIITPLFTRRILRNDLKYLDIHSVDIHFDEFKILVQSKSLIKIDIFCGIFYDNYIKVPLEDLFAEILHVRQISFSRSFITPETSEKLLTLKFKNKIERLNFLFVEGVPPLDVNNFFIFLQNNLAPKANLSIQIYYVNGQGFYQALKQLIETWKPESEKPLMSR